MKFSTISLLSLTTFILPSLAAPAPAAALTNIEDTIALEPRQLSSAYTLVSNLYTEVQQYTGAINETAAGLTSSSTEKEKRVAAKAFRVNVRHITGAVKATRAQVKALQPEGVEKRQTDAALAALVAALLEDISGALNNIIATLGLGALLGALNPLVGSLSALLLSLEVVVDNLLALVKQIVDGLLTGLSIGLAGLNL